ncbi:MAG: chemotaxis protein CheW [Candidatus Promineifilaceae bacterium]
MADNFELMRIEIGDRTYGVLRRDMQSVQHGNRVRVKPSGSNPPAILPTTQGNLPVYSLGDMLGVAHQVTYDLQRVLILYSRWGLWGLTVDRINQWELIDSSHLQPFPSIASPDGIHHYQYVLTLNNEMLLILNPSELHPYAQFDEKIEPALEDIPLPLVEKQHGQLILFTPSGLDPQANDIALGFVPKQVDEVLRESVLHPVPSSPPDVHGLLNWRGQAVPIIDFAARLGLRDSNEALKDARRVIIVRSTGNNRSIGFFARASIDFLELPVKHQAIDVPEDFPPNLLHGIVDYKGKMVVIPKLDQLAA